jgi:hypothetical protein
MSDWVAGRKLDFGAAVVLSFLSLSFHLFRLIKAGGLWRDEAATAHLASHFSFQYVIQSSQYELFPALLPAVLHIYGLIAGLSDPALRIFGASVGILLLIILWWNMRVVCRSFPLVSLALLGFNSAFIQWGDEIRGYGLGICFLLLSVGLVWQVVENPTPWRVVAASLAGLASVQCLFNNACLLLVVCLSAMVIGLRRSAGGARENPSPTHSSHSEKGALLALAIGIPAALSLIPYIEPLGKARDWDVVVRAPVGFGYLCERMTELLSASGWWNVAFWAILFLFAIGMGLLGQFRRFELSRREQDILLFSLLSLLTGVFGYFFLLLIVGYPSQLWYYLSLAAFVALFLDFTCEALKAKWVRNARGIVVSLIVISSVYPTLRNLRDRQSNVDLAAARLTAVAAKDDLVLVTPWFTAVSFDRYYHGTARWMTIPPVDFHKFHRYDLIKTQMLLADQDAPIQPVLEAIDKTLKSGHRVWVAGQLQIPKAGEVVPSLQPAPDKTWEWQNEAYTSVWSLKVGAYLAACARMEDVPLGPEAPINHFENLSLKRFEGTGFSR